MSARTRRSAAVVGLVLTAIWVGLGAASCAGAAGERLNDLPRLVDGAGLLTSAEEAELERRLDEISERRHLEVVVVTTPTLGQRTSTQFADDFYDYGPSRENRAVPGDDVTQGYGWGEKRTGILFLVCPEERDWALSTTGDAIEMFTDARQESMTSKIVPYLSRLQWASGLEEFADQVDSVYGRVATIRVVTVIAVSLIAGLIAGFTPVTIWKRQLKSVRPAVGAVALIDPASLVLTGANDRLVRRSTHVIDMSSSSGGGGGGSSTHSGSSGISHGGSSGKF